MKKQLAYLGVLIVCTAIFCTAITSGVMWVAVVCGLSMAVTVGAMLIE